MLRTMRDFIKESPVKMRENIANAETLTKRLAQEYDGYKNIWIIASGSSKNASFCAAEFMKKTLSRDVKIIPPFTFSSYENDFSKDDFVFAISQSGYSSNIIEALKKIKEKGRKAIVLTADPQSDIKNFADIVIDYGCGEETVSYVTLGVATLTTFLILFSLAAAKKKIGDNKYNELLNEVKKIPKIHESSQEKFIKFYSVHRKNFLSMTNAYVCALGANIGSAMEAALKIGETVKIPISFYEAEEYIHGPNLQLDPLHAVFIIDGGVGSKRLLEIFKGTKIVTDRTYFVTCGKYADDNVLSLEFDLMETLSPICFLPVFQLLAFFVTDELKKWRNHPLEELMEKSVSGKTAGYANSSLEKYVN
jgi:glucoselysine-6-phosphate deglycase